MPTKDGDAEDAPTPPPTAPPKNSNHKTKENQNAQDPASRTTESAHDPASWATKGKTEANSRTDLHLGTETMYGMSQMEKAQLPQTKATNGITPENHTKNDVKTKMKIIMMIIWG